MAADEVPAWFLAPHEDKELIKRVQEQSNEKCALYFGQFAKCCRNHQLFFSWKCAEQKKAMVDCVAHWGSWEVFEEERAKYIREKQYKRQQRSE